MFIYQANHNKFSSLCITIISLSVVTVIVHYYLPLITKIYLISTWQTPKSFIRHNALSVSQGFFGSIINLFRLFLILPVLHLFYVALCVEYPSWPECGDLLHYYFILCWSVYIQYSLSLIKIYECPRNNSYPSLSAWICFLFILRSHACGKDCCLSWSYPCPPPATFQTDTCPSTQSKSIFCSCFPRI